MLKTINVSSPIYYVISGVERNEGVIIERNRNDYRKMYTLSDENWYLLQTNTDKDYTSKDLRYQQTLSRIESLG